MFNCMYFTTAGLRQRGHVGGEFLFPFARRFFNVQQSPKFIESQQQQQQQPRGKCWESVDVAGDVTVELHSRKGLLTTTTLL